MAETRRVPCLYCGKNTSFREIPNWPNRVVYHASCADPGRGMRTVWKFTMPYQRDVVATWSIPAGARLVHVATDTVNPGSLAEPALSAWFEVDPDADKEFRVFEVFGTGQPIPDGAGEYRGTIREGWLVVHLYERTDHKNGDRS